MTPDHTWVLMALITVLAFLFRRQGERWVLVLSKVAMLVGASGLVAALLALGLGLLR